MYTPSGNPPTIREVTKLGVFLYKGVQMIKTAILVDGAFYRKRACYFWGEKTPADRANELRNYCTKHISKEKAGAELYRVFYYDCPPIAKKVYHPLLRRAVDLERTPIYSWSLEFFDELKHQRKFALRLGRLSEEQARYNIKPDITKRIFSGAKSIDDLTEQDFVLDISQKGVDMRIGVDISSLAFKKQVDRIVLISGDSDFVPAAKQARREGIDFIIDSMRSTIKPDLFEHIDGMRTYVPKNRQIN